MPKEKFVKDYMDEAKFRINTAKLALEKQRFSSVVRECQLIVELSSKALLRRWNFAILKNHNISNHLLDAKELFNKNIQDEISFMVKISKKLRREYEISLYGDEDLDLPPSEIYQEKQVINILDDSIKFYNLCQEELKEYLK